MKPWKWPDTNIERRCYSCGAPIFECMGHTKVGDFIRFCNGENLIPRELCGMCIEMFEWTKHETLRSPRQETIEFLAWIKSQR